jgi:hypothetical protein
LDWRRGDAFFDAIFCRKVRSSMTSIARSQLHKRSTPRGLHSRPREAALWLSSSSALLISPVGYQGIVVAAATNFGLCPMWLQPSSTTEPKDTGAVSNPSEQTAAPGGSQARLHQEVEGSFPSPATEQANQPAPLLYKRRVVPETQRGSARRNWAHTSISRHQHAAPVRWACSIRHGAELRAT